MEVIPFFGFTSSPLEPKGKIWCKHRVYLPLGAPHWPGSPYPMGLLDQSAHRSRMNSVSSCQHVPGTLIKYSFSVFPIPSEPLGLLKQALQDLLSTHLSISSPNIFCLFTSKNLVAISLQKHPFLPFFPWLTHWGLTTSGEYFMITIRTWVSAPTLFSQQLSSPV